jgi:hypothetical protein
MTGFDLTRRNVLAGLLVSMAAPAIIRSPGLLMPIRSRLILPSLAEVLAYQAQRAETARRRLFVNFTAEGASRIFRMAEAEKRYRAMGLL